MTAEDVRRSRSRLASVLFSPDEHRLRAGWRLTLQAMLQIALTLAMGCAALALPSTWSTRVLNPTSVWGLAAGALAELGAVTFSVWLVRRLLDHRSFAGLGLRLRPRAYRDLVAGIGIAVVIMGFIYLAEWRLGWLSVAGFAWESQSASDVIGNSLAFLMIFALVGWNEEVMSRGYHLQTISSGLNLAWGLAISSAIFGALHLTNPHATLMSAAGIFLAGLLLGYAYVRTGQLWCSIGLHIGWNFFEGVVLGFPVSGLATFRLVETRISGPDLWTGGAFGPEAGLIVVPAILAGAALIHFYGRRTYQSASVNPSRPV